MWPSLSGPLRDAAPLRTKLVALMQDARLRNNLGIHPAQQARGMGEELLLRLVLAQATPVREQDQRARVRFSLLDRLAAEGAHHGVEHRSSVPLVGRSATPGGFRTPRSQPAHVFASADSGSTGTPIRQDLCVPSTEGAALQSHYERGARA